MMVMPNKTSPLEAHQEDYKPKAWEMYTLQELGMWVHLFHERAIHRTEVEKATKDLHDAKNYLWMVEQKLKARCEELNIDWGAI